MVLKVAALQTMLAQKGEHQTEASQVTRCNLTGRNILLPFLLLPRKTSECQYCQFQLVCEKLHLLPTNS